MVTNNIQVVCPKCKTVNSYTITDMQLYDNDLHIAYSCEACGNHYTDTYILVYNGGGDDSIAYDRDNLISC